MIAVGGRIPEVTLFDFKDGPKPLQSNVVLGIGKIAVFGLPGAYTPTCHKEHLPGFVSRAGDFKNKGVTEIVCVSVNDPFVMDAWGRELGAGGKVRMLSDGNGDLTRALGLDADLSGVGLGTRSKRYSMLLDGGVVKEFNVEDDVSAHTICSAVHLLTQL